MTPALPARRLPTLPAEPTERPSLGACLLLAVAWYVALVGLVLALDAALSAAQLGPRHLTAAAFGNWDAEHYQYIRDHGYDVQRTAFFPLFPLLWRALGVGPVVMGLLNGLLFAGSFAALAWAFAWSRRQQLLALAVPQLLFMFLPFSEAVFFGSGALVLIGLRRAHGGWCALGLVLSCLSRPAAFVLLPAIGATAVLTRPAGLVGWRSWAVAARRAGLGGALAALGLGLSLVVQHHDTGHWLGFLEAQKYWDNHLQWPHLPLRNWGTTLPRLVEASAFAVVLAALGYLGYVARHHWTRPLPATAAPVVFAATYLVSVTAIVLATRGGLLVSLSRYVYATPYFLLLLAQVVGQVRLTGRQLGGLALALEILWLTLFGATEHIRTTLQFTLVTLIVTLWLANAHRSPLLRQRVLLPTLLLGLGLGLLLLLRFLSHEWVA